MPCSQNIALRSSSSIVPTKADPSADPCHEEPMVGAYFSPKDRPTTAEVARFFDKVQITKSCWPCTDSLDGHGYGRLTFRGKRFQAHRFSYELFVGPIEAGKHVLHRKECSNRACVNPNHLYLGTNADNVRDRELWGKTSVGENNCNSKLTEEDVLTIRHLHKQKGFGYTKIARLFPVCHVNVGGICKRQYWKHI